MRPLVIRLIDGRVAGHVGVLLVAVALVLLLLLCLLVTVAAEHLVEEGAELSGYGGGEGEEGEEDEVEGAHFLTVRIRWKESVWTGEESNSKRAGGVVVILAARVAMRWDDDVGKLSITRLAGWAMVMPLVMDGNSAVVAGSYGASPLQGPCWPICPNRHAATGPSSYRCYRAW